MSTNQISETATEEWFYFFQDGQTQGPITLGELKALAIDGLLKAEAVVC